MADKATITELMDQAIREGTFTTEALDQFKVVRERAEMVQRENKTMGKELSDSRAARDELERHVRTAEEGRKTAEELASRNAEMKIRLAAAEATASTLRECFSLVFRNETVHRNVTEPVLRTDHYDPSTGSSTNQRTEYVTTTEDTTKT